MTTDNIRTEVEDLLAYFPGRHRVALLWLIILPAMWLAVDQGFFDRMVTSAPSDHGRPSYLLFTMAGASFQWACKLTLAVVLLRICHSARASWTRSVEIMTSSLIYSLIVTVPAFFITSIWTGVCSGTSLSALFQISAGLVLSIGGLLVLVVLLGSLAHRFGLAIPLLIILTINYYLYLLPIVYPENILSAHWRAVETFGIPLFPTTIILRHGMLNQGFAPVTYWAGAITQALIGYGLAFWIWNTATNTPEPKVADHA